MAERLSSTAARFRSASSLDRTAVLSLLSLAEQKSRSPEKSAELLEDSVGSNFDEVIQWVIIQNGGDVTDSIVGKLDTVALIFRHEIGQHLDWERYKEGPGPKTQLSELVLESIELIAAVYASTHVAWPDHDHTADNAEAEVKLFLIKLGNFFYLELGDLRPPLARLFDQAIKTERSNSDAVRVFEMVTLRLLSLTIAKEIQMIYPTNLSTFRNFDPPPAQDTAYGAEALTSSVVRLREQSCLDYSKLKWLLEPYFISAHHPMGKDEVELTRQSLMVDFSVAIDWCTKWPDDPAPATHASLVACQTFFDRMIKHFLDNDLRLYIVLQRRLASYEYTFQAIGEVAAAYATRQVEWMPSDLQDSDAKHQVQIFIFKLQQKRPIPPHYSIIREMLKDQFDHALSIQATREDDPERGFNEVTSFELRTLCALSLALAKALKLVKPDVTTLRNT